MYTREIRNAPRAVVRAGKPVFGDFNTLPSDFDIRKLKQPFSLMPLPRFITDSRIRTNLYFSFASDEYAGRIGITDAHLFGFAEFTLWEKASGRKISFRSFIIFRKRLVPFKIKSGVCKSLRKKRIFIIRWNYDTGKFSVLCRLKGDRTRPHTFFEFSGNLNDEGCGFHTSVIPAPLMRRCSAVHHCAPLLRGSLSGHFFEKEDKPAAEPVEALGFFTVRRSYYKLRTFCYAITVLGESEGKAVRFNLYTSNQDPVDSDLYNENILFVDGKASPLPPVTVTHPYGLAGLWVIQDTENMVDLSFSPLSDTIRRESALILRTEYHTIYGTCEGFVRDTEGETFLLKNVCAVVKKQYLRL
ncbi:DUF2804 family protein [Treponema sp. HNW]|uniref:DUF2804 family protein n=1 Tax=Treponema sp. HNW TaxID=3116654 RepID=UPI003D0EDB51